MKWFTILGILTFAFVATWAAPSAELLVQTRPFSANLVPRPPGVFEKEGNVALREPVLPRDWLSDIIKAILGIDVPVLLAQIDTTLKGLDRLVNSAVRQLNEIIGNVPEDVKNDINAIIENAFMEALHIVEPILRQLGIVLPAISNKSTEQAREVGTNDFVTDIIEALLGISLEDFLTDIANAMIQIEQLLDVTLNRLQDIAIHHPAIADRLNTIKEDCIVESQELIRPMLDKLYQVLPIRPHHKDLIVRPNPFAVNTA